MQVVFGVAFIVAAIAAAADLWGNDRTYYGAFAREARLDRVAFHFPTQGADRMLTLEEILRVDEKTRLYVVCGTALECTRFEHDSRTDLTDFYTTRELGHLSDVRTLFAGVRIAGVGAAAVAVLTALTLSRRRIRRALVVDAVAVVAFGVLAAVAFEPLFLAFHQVFFPQGNFLFDPARDNLILIYPEEYWLGVTLRLGATVVLLSASVGALVGLPIRSDLAVRLKKERVE